MKNDLPVILASSSPRRIELIKMLGFSDVTIVPPCVDETMYETTPPEETVRHIALRKAESIVPDVPAAAKPPLIIAADTLVYSDGLVFGKPADAKDAERMLRILSGKCHSVYTGVALLHSGKRVTFEEKTDVYFRRLSDLEINKYIASGEPLDKAGAYGAQGGAAVFIERIDGDFFNVVGLPVCRLSVVIEEFVI